MLDIHYSAFGFVWQILSCNASETYIKTVNVVLKLINCHLIGFCQSHTMTQKETYSANISKLIVFLSQLKYYLGSGHYPRIEVQKIATLPFERTHKNETQCLRGVLGVAETVVCDSMYFCGVFVSRLVCSVFTIDDRNTTK